MEFPTVEAFEQNKEQLVPIMKWRELPENIIYHVISVTAIETPAAEFGPGTAMYAEVEDGERNQYKVWLPARLCIELKDYGWHSREAFFCPKGLKQSEKNIDRQYFDYDIMWVAC